MTVAIVVLVIGAAIVAFLLLSPRVLREYERGICFRLGRLRPIAGPGIDLPEALRRPAHPGGPPDGHPDHPAAGGDHPRQRPCAGERRRVLPGRRPRPGHHRGGGLSRRNLADRPDHAEFVLGKADLDTLLSERDELNDSLRRIIDEQTEPWGIKVTTVEIKDVEIPEAMQRAMARGAEAERERRAKIISAEGEFQASQKLLEASEVLSRNPAAMQLRYQQTLVELGGDKSTIVFPLPLDLIAPFINALRNGHDPESP